MMEKKILESYNNAKEAYAAWGVDTDRALSMMDEAVISLNCWQGDDVGGFESAGDALTGGIQVTGNYPGKANNGAQLRGDIETALGLIPGECKVNLHAIYAEPQGAKIDRDALEPEHFSAWVKWAKEKGLGLDFNPTMFSHPKSDADGFTLASKDKGIRDFWIEHAKRCRRIGEHFGRETGKTCVTNVWAPDGYKDIPIDRAAPRQHLKDSLDAVFAEKIDRRFNIDAVESKLFGIGSESYVVGSHEFYLGYALKNDVMLCLDAGHFHPTEVISNKISAALMFMDELLLHVSRPVRWDSDHVVIYDDELLAIMQEVVRGGYLNRVHLALDFFDGSINRIAAWVIGTRATRRALLTAMLEPTEKLRALEAEGDLTSRLALLEEFKAYPHAAVWDYYCLKKGVPVREAWLGEVKDYEKNVLSKR